MSMPEASRELQWCVLRLSTGMPFYHDSGFRAGQRCSHEIYLGSQTRANARNPSQMREIILEVENPCKEAEPFRLIRTLRYQFRAPALQLRLEALQARLEVH